MSHNSNRWAIAALFMFVSTFAATETHAIEIRVIAGSSAANSSIQLGPFTPFGSIDIPSAVFQSGDTFRGSQFFIAENSGIMEFSFHGDLNLSGDTVNLSGNVPVRFKVFGDADLTGASFDLSANGNVGTLGGGSGGGGAGGGSSNPLGFRFDTELGRTVGFSPGGNSGDGGVAGRGGEMLIRPGDPATEAQDGGNGETGGSGLSGGSGKRGNTGGSGINGFSSNGAANGGESSWIHNGGTGLGAGGHGGVGGAGGSAETENAVATNGLDGAWGTRGEDGADGGKGANGGGGQNFAGTTRSINDLSAGGGGAGGQGGGGGQLGGGGGAGGGGGGGGGEDGYILQGGEFGGAGGDGGQGGDGGDGGHGGTGGDGGGGAGLFDIFAFGNLKASNAIFTARGGSGADGNSGEAGLLGEGSNVGDDGVAKEDAGNGGQGGAGLFGGNGGDGGDGGDGGGGAGGTVRLMGTTTTLSGTTIDARGGNFGSSRAGEDGAFLLGNNQAQSTAGVTQTTSDTITGAGPRTANPFVNGNAETPFLRDLVNGPEGFGISEDTVDAAARQAARDANGARTVAYFGSNAAPVYGGDSFAAGGFNTVEIVNLSEVSLDAPALGIADSPLTGALTPLQTGGIGSNTQLGGDGTTTTLGALGAGQRFLTTAPTDRNFALATLGMGGETKGFVAGGDGFITFDVRAQGQLSTNTVDLGAVRVGGGALNATVTVSNTATNLGIYSDTLTANASSSSSSPFSPDPATTGEIAAGDNTTLNFSLSDATSGTFSETRAVTYTSVNNYAGANFGDVVETNGAGTEMLNINGRVYQQAEASVSGVDPINSFGIVHVGDGATFDFSVTNTATGALADRLALNSLSFGGSTFSLASGPGELASGETGTMTIAADTATAGTFGNTGSGTFVSRNDELADVSANGDAVAAFWVVQVNNYADANLQQTGGDGTFAALGGDAFEIDFGTVLAGDAAGVANLFLLNDVLGPSDLLSGMWDLSGLDAGFMLSGFDPLIDLDAGEGQALSVFWDPALVLSGLYEFDLVFNGTGSNGSGYEGDLWPLTLSVRLNVAANATAVPEPGSAALLAATVAALIYRRRRTYS